MRHHTFGDPLSEPDFHPGSLRSLGQANGDNDNDDFRYETSTDQSAEIDVASEPPSFYSGGSDRQASEPTRERPDPWREAAARPGRNKRSAQEEEEGDFGGRRQPRARPRRVGPTHAAPAPASSFGPSQFPQHWGPQPTSFGYCSFLRGFDSCANLFRSAGTTLTSTSAG